MSELWACWTEPDEPAAGAAVLSFLPPLREERLRRSWRGAWRGARDASPALRRQALHLYVELIGRVGTAPARGTTLRAALRPEGEASLWWYHPCAFKDCESDPTFDLILAALAIRDAARDRGCRRIVLWGGPRELAEALTGLDVRQRGARPRSPRPAAAWARGLASRARMAWTLSRQARACRGLGVRPPRRAPVALYSFWDWGLSDSGQGLRDRYYQGLPDALARRSCAVSWLAWIDPAGAAGGGRPLSDALAPLRGRDSVVPLQAYLDPAEIAALAMDLGPARLYGEARRSPAFRESFRTPELDAFPLLDARLMAGFLDARIPRLRLAARACARALAEVRPRWALSFLEHHPFARAFYDGARRAGAGARTAAVQHSSYSHGKSFLFLHPALELKPGPDGCSVPRPDRVFAMGDLGRELFKECGYADEDIRQTGSPRYERVREPREDDAASAPPARPAPPAGGGRLLLLAGLDSAHDAEMVEAAAAAAGEGWELRLREHPFSRLSRLASVARLASRLAVSSASLDEDVAWADVALFTYSTTAEESLVAGKPVWQWIALGYDASALPEAAAVPRFNAISDLRDALESFARRPEAFRPSLESRRGAWRRLFAGGSSASACEAIADVLAPAARREPA